MHKFLVNDTHIFVIIPLLIATHAMTSDEIYWTVCIRCIQTVVIGHNLLSLGISKDLVSTQAVAITTADFLT